jgi:hypothetical protein
MNSHTARSLLFAAAIIPKDAPLAERIRVLESFLEPKPGSLITIDQKQLRDQGPITKDAGKLFGTIRVSPPKGTCFILTKNKSIHDENICKPTSVKWHLEDLDKESGTLSWSLRTGPQDFGTPIYWKAPYVIAKTMPPESDFYKWNSTPVFFKSCVPQRASRDGRKRQIVLTKFDNSQWIIRFPDQDTPIPPSEPLSAIADAKEPKEAKESKEAETHESKPKTANGPIKVDDIVANREPWTINTGRGYEMNVENFISDGSMPPGKKGTCRYVYDYIPGDFSMGRLECHHTDQYLYVYMFLPCMEPIRPKS